MHLPCRVRHFETMTSLDQIQPLSRMRKPVIFLSFHQISALIAFLFKAENCTCRAPAIHLQCAPVVEMLGENFELGVAQHS